MRNFFRVSLILTVAVFVGCGSSESPESAELRSKMPSLSAKLDAMSSEEVSAFNGSLCLGIASVEAMTQIDSASEKTGGETGYVANLGLIRKVVAQKVDR